MTGIRVRALTEVGNAAMHRAMEADNGRRDWKGYFYERKEADEPMVVVIEHRNRLSRVAMSSAYLRELVEKQLTALGAVRMIDFEVTTL